MEFCVICFKRNPTWRQSLFTCSKKCSNARNWQTPKERREGIKSSEEKSKLTGGQNDTI